MTDLSQFKSPVYQGINDVPREPTETQAGNGSDLIKRLNSLCDYLSENLAPVATSGNFEDLENPPSKIENWNVNGTVYENVTSVAISGSFINATFSDGQLTLDFQGTTNPTENPA